jgi:peptide/nickel transport system substrate-binding protein
MFKRFRFYVALISAFIKRDKRKITFGVIGLLIFVFLLKVLIPAATPKFAEMYEEFRRPTFVEGAVGVPEHPNPLFDSTETQRDISKLVFRGLLKVDSEGNLDPDLAERFEKVGEQDYIFYLRKDVFWHDGERFSSDDVVYTVRQATDPDLDTKIADNFKDVEVEKIDEFTIKFRLKESFSPFPYATTVGIIPKHISLRRYKPVGTGAFEVKEITKEEIKLYNKELNLVFRFYPSFKDAKIALKLGEIHALGGYSPQGIEKISNFGGKMIYRQVLPRRQAIAFFNTREVHVKNKKLRQALAYAVDKKQLAAIAGGRESVVSTNQLTLGNWVVDSVERYPMNMKLAKDLLREVGYKFEKGSWKKKKEVLKLKVTTAVDSELNSIANFLKLSWEKIGIDVEVESVDIDTLRKKTIPNRNYQVLVNFQEIPIDPDQYVLWHTTQVRRTNITGIRSPKLDKLLEDTRKVESRRVRSNKYRLFTKLLLDEAPAMFLYYPEYIWVVSNKVEGINMSEFESPVDRFNSYMEWRINDGFKFLKI